MRLNLFCLSLTCLLFALGVQAQEFAPSPQQIQQFRSLSPAQQQQMAESAGIDLQSLGVSRDRSSQPNIQDTPSPEDEKPDGADLEDEHEEDQLNLEPGSGGGLPLFGRDLFRMGAQTFRPAVDIPVPVDYVLGPGDTLVLQLYGKENAAHSLVVNREGQIQFPQIGPVSLAGLNFSQAQQVINDIVGEQMIGVRASITMGALRTIRVFVLGEVEKPGSFTVGSLSTMTNALFASGGISQVGSLRNVQLKRQGKLITTLDLYDLLLRGDTSKDARLLPGDVIFVPPIGNTVGVTGSVKRPATYELRGATTTQDLIRLAGGPTNTSHLPDAYLIRLDTLGERMSVNVDLSKPAGLNLGVRDGDVLHVPSTLDFINNQVILAGHIKRDGPRSWRPKLRFTDLIPSAFNLLPNPDVDLALIQRFSAETRRVEVILFSPSAAWEAPGTDADPLLHGSDVVQVFDYQTPRPEQLAEVVAQLAAQARYNERQKVVSISGSVRFPGMYPLSDGMTTEHLIQLAGGLTESAFGINGEVTRYEIDENRQRVVRHINLDLTSEPKDLVPGDTLQVKQVPLWKNKETVEVAGEVMFPGTYTILPGETLLEVLNRAGGMTPHAYPLGAVFSRQELRELEQQRLLELRGKLQDDLVAASLAGEQIGREELDPTDAENILQNLETVRPLGRMVIDLPSIMNRPKVHDFQLEDGDRITIPRYKPSVTVVGEVQYPTSHFYDETLTTIEYVERSGGMKKQADKSRIYIVKANGSVSQPTASAWFRSERDIIQPGDTIIVPLETDRVDRLTVWARATQIIYQAALGAAAIGSL